MLAYGPNVQTPLHDQVWNSQTGGGSIATVWVGVAMRVAVKTVQDVRSADVGGG